MANLEPEERMNFEEETYENIVYESELKVEIHVNNFERLIKNQLISNYEDPETADCIIACDGNLLKAHKTILAAGSGYFKHILKQSPKEQKHIFFADVAFDVLKDLIQFMYTGKIKIPKNRVEEYISFSKRIALKPLAATLIDDFEIPTFDSPLQLYDLPEPTVQISTTNCGPVPGPILTPSRVGTPGPSNAVLPFAGPSNEGQLYTAPTYDESTVGETPFSGSSYTEQSRAAPPFAGPSYASPFLRMPSDGIPFAAQLYAAPPIPRPTYGVYTQLGQPWADSVRPGSPCVECTPPETATPAVDIQTPSSPAVVELSDDE
ncbi:unnamed protein product [Chrysodeixis includens]|uniref:BTB domain-containing protein n=1 Tax=Chrysodeixis includens TaxID=689277 RepID=A0A9P0BKN9_CHRIL|nr:unnamed protein product [Chrysodeixis includens]